MKTRTIDKISSLAKATLALIIFGATIGTAAPGDLDLTFSGDGKLLDFLSRGDDSSRGVATQTDGKIVVAGWSLGDFAVARYNTDGSLDTSFGTDGRVTTDFNSSYDQAYSIAIQQDGKVVAAGVSYSDFALVRYNPDGSLDTTFGTGGKVTTPFNSGAHSSAAYSVAIHTDGKIVAAGEVQSDFALARYNPNGSLDTSFDGDGKVTTDIFSLEFDEAYSVAIHSNGKIVAAGRGYNTTSARNVFTLVQYNLDGSLDTSFDGDGKATVPTTGHSRANSVAIQADGKIVAVGQHGSAVNASDIVGYRFNIDGSVNGQWGTHATLPGFFGYAYGNSVAVQPDGKIVTVGNVQSGQNFGLALLRLNADLSGDSTFGSNGVLIRPLDSYFAISSAAVQPDGKIVVTGNSSSPSDLDFEVFRFNNSGAFDTSFDGDGKVQTDFGFFQGNALYNTAIQADGKIVAAGEVFISGFNWGSDFVLLRYNSDGSPDTTFGSGTGKVRTDMGSRGEQARAVAIQPDGKIAVAGGSSDQDDNSCCFALARYNVDGSLDATFGVGGRVITGSFLGHSGGASDVVIQPDGKIVAAGYSNEFNYPNGGFAVYRYNSNGSLDTSFGGDGTVTTPIGSYAAFATAVAIQPDGKIVAAGSNWDYESNAVIVVRYNPNGSLDSTFDGDGIVTTLTSQHNEVYSSVLQPDGKIIVAGSRSINSNETGFALIRYNGDGSLDTTFGAAGVVTTQVGLHSGAQAVALQPNGKIVAAGSSRGVGNTGDFAVVRYNANGSLDTAFSGDGITTADFDNSADNAYGLALDNAARALVVGESEGSFALARFLLAPRPTQLDFDGDGQSDVSVFRSTDRVWYMNRSTAGFAAVQFGLPTDKITPADFDGDGKTDIAVYRDGTWWRINSSTSTMAAVSFGLASDIPVPADYRGDGRAELAIYRGGTWWSLDLSNNQVQANQFGISTDKPVPADFDGDGKTDQGVYRHGEWHLNRSSHGYTVASFGLPTDKPLVGDYDGDGKADTAVYRDGTWYLLQSAEGLRIVQWGLSTDIPTAADYDGDGKVDPAVFRDGVWYLLQSTSGISIRQFGLSGDTPIQSAYLP